ncbi:MAG TPA: 30S ribosomal protein S20 [bacterium]|nr:30S ribosomal protein S20 [bacterium]
MVKLKSGRHTQALKSQRQDKKRHLRNVAVKTKIRTIAKKVETAVVQGKPEEAKKIFLQAMKELDKAASKNIIPKRRASRKKSRLAKKINTLKEKK